MDLELHDFQTTYFLPILGLPWSAMVQSFATCEDVLLISGDDPLNLPFALFVKRFSVGAED